MTKDSKAGVKDGWLSIRNAARVWVDSGGSVEEFQRVAGIAGRFATEERAADFEEWALSDSEDGLEEYIRRRRGIRHYGGGVRSEWRGGQLGHNEPCYLRGIVERWEKRGRTHPAFVYALWSGRTLVYVGVTVNVANRLGSHLRRFGLYVDRVQIMPRSCYYEARALEETLIRRHQPIGNTAR